MIRYELQGDLRDIFARLGKTVVLVTHDLGEGAFLGDHVVLMREGRIVQEGPLAELERAPADSFVTRFFQAQRLPCEHLFLVGLPLGALIGAGGYEQPILTGIRLDDTALILQGAVPAAALALLVSGLFELIERLVVPRGLRL